jgi:hypothetical protein
MGSAALGVYKINTINLFFLEFGPCLLTSFHFISSYEAGFYKPTVHKLHPPLFAGLQHMQQCQVTFPQF